MEPAIDSKHSGLEAALATLRNRKWLVLLCLAGTTLAATVFSLLQEKQYTASTSLLFRDPGFAQSLFGAGPVFTIGDPTREAATNVELVGLEVVGAQTADAIGGAITAGEVSNMISVSAAGQSNVVSVAATSPTALQAQRVANTFARQFIAFRAEADRSKLLQAQRLANSEFRRLPLIERRGVRGESLSRAAERLGVLASLQTGNAELVQPAGLPGAPSSPKPVRNAILGAILGLFLGVGLAFLFERLNRRIREPEDVEPAFGLPVLATVPESSAFLEVDQDGLPFAEQEAFRTLRAGLRYFNVDREVASVLVTSSATSEGKTTVAWYLARAASANSRVLCIEADLRRPSFAQRWDLAVGPGLAELLTHQVELDEAIQSVDIPHGNGASAGSMEVIVAGAAPPNPTELIASQAMTDLLNRLTADYDFVVIDTPPTGVVSDAFPLVIKVTGVIVVARLGQTTRDAATHLRDQLDRLKAPLLGVVANGVKRRRNTRYGYDYYSPSTDSRVPATIARQR